MLLTRSRPVPDQYELRIRMLRNEKLALGRGFVTNFLLLLLLIFVFLLQHGRTVGTRFELVRALKEQLGSITTDTGITFDTVASTDDIWAWTNKFFSTTSAQATGRNGQKTRTYICTYNQVIGAVRFEATRVGDKSCAYRKSSWSEYMLKQRRKTLTESDMQECYGSVLSQTSFGPWYDTERYLFSPTRGSHFIDMPRDPTWAAMSFVEMQQTDFLSMNTRSFSIAFTVFNNALPMLCYVRLVFEITATGAYDSRYEIEALNVLEYLDDDFWLQVLLESILLIQTAWHAWLQVRKVKKVIRGAKRLGASVLRALRRHFFQFSVLLDAARTATYISHYFHWYLLVADRSRDVDLETEEFVELDHVTAIAHQYNTQFNVILIISLLHLLQYVGLDDRMALLTRSVGNSISDLIPFMILFVIFVAIFACIGHLLYGPVLIEWSTISNSLRTAIDIMIGNYMFEQLQEGIPVDKVSENLVGAVFFYSYFFLMMLITLNLIIAILMDGYASVKELDTSEVQRHIRYNIGGLRSTISLLLTQPMKRNRYYKRFFGAVKYPVTGNLITKDLDPWTNEEWVLCIKEVQMLREKQGLCDNILSVGVFMHHLREVITARCRDQSRLAKRGVEQAKKDLEDLPEQIIWAFHQRDWYPPSYLNRPFDEPSDHSRIRLVEKTVVNMEERQRYMLYLVDALGNPEKTASYPPPSAAEYASRTKGVDTQQLLELVVSQQETISQLLAQQKQKQQEAESKPNGSTCSKGASEPSSRTLVRRRRRTNGTPMAHAASTPALAVPMLPNYGLGSLHVIHAASKVSTPAQRAMGSTMETLRQLSKPPSPPKEKPPTPPPPTRRWPR